MEEEIMMRTKTYTFLLVAATLLLGACEFNDSDASGDSSSGVGGSLARFTVAGDYLYTVDENSLNVFDLSNPEKPVFRNEKELGFGAETIFPKGENLFIGTQTGMYIYDISNAGNPTKLSFFEHVMACDPVVADDSYAYVTLNSNNQRCWRWVNELQVIDISDLKNPVLKKNYQMIGPLGLAVKNDSLWVCDAGLKLFDISDKMNIKELYHNTSIPAHDVIVNGGLLIAIAEDGFHQLKLENNTITELSKILIYE